MMFARVWRGIRDAVIGNYDGAWAYRVWEADFDPHKPFHTEEDITMWRAIGPFMDVSKQLLDLEDEPPQQSHFLSRRRRRTMGPPSSGELAGDESGRQVSLRASG